MKKTRILFLVIAMLICVMPASVFAYEMVDVYINGGKLQTDQPAVVYQDRTLVPVRAVADAFQCEVEWDEATSTVHITNPVQMIAVKIGSYEIASKNRETNTTVTIPIDVPAMTINDRTMLPLRAVAEALNVEVEWDSTTNSVHLKREYDYVSGHTIAYTGGITTVGKTVDGVKKFGLVNGKGELIIPCEYGIGSFMNTYKGKYVDARDYDTGKYGVLDLFGNVVVPFEYDYIYFYYYQEGVEDFEIESPRFYENNLIMVKKDNKDGVIDIDNNVIIPCEYDSVNCKFSIYGFSPFEKKYGILTVERDGKMGKIMYDGAVLFPCEYGYIEINDDGSFNIWDNKTPKWLGGKIVESGKLNDSFYNKYK